MNSLIFERMNRKYNSYDLYKDIAFITMLLDHTGLYIFPKIRLFRVIGRVSALIYAVLFGMTKHSGKRRNKILIYGLITTAIQVYFLDTIFPVNTLYNFYLSSFVIDYCYEFYEKYPYVVLFIFIPMLLPLGFIVSQVVQYGTFFPSFMLCGKIFLREKKTVIDMLVTSLIFILYGCYSSYHFNFGVVYTIPLLLAIVLVYYFMFNFKFREYENVPQENFLLLMSRYSLELFPIQTLFFLFLSLRILIYS